MRSGTADHGVYVPSEQQTQETSPCSEVQSQRRIPERIAILIGSVTLPPYRNALAPFVVAATQGGLSPE